MADTAPTAVPDPQPNTTLTAPTAGAGGLSGLIAGVLDPVQPARPTMNDTSTAHAEGTTAAGASSADYHPDTDDQDNGKTSKTGAGAGARVQQSVVRAWLLAGAERWKKGPNVRMKRLDVAKARAMAARSNGTSSGSSTSQVQAPGRTRTSGGGTGPAASGAGSKGLTSKTRSGGTGTGGSGNGPKNTTPKSNGPKSSGPSRSSSENTPKGTGNRSPKAPKTPAPRKETPTAPKSTGDASSANRTPGKDKKPGKPQSAGVLSPQAPHGGLPPKTPKPKENTAAGADTAASPATTPGTDTKTKSSKTSAAGTQTGPRVTARLRKALAGTDPNTPAAGKDQTAKLQPENDGKQNPAKSGDKPTTGKPGTTNSSATVKAPNLKASRETGYRDGTRTGTLAAHMQAYRDGVKDGWRDTQQAAAHEKNRLDHAHTWRKAKKETPAMPPTATDAKPQPLTVAAVTPTHVLLGPDANRPDMPRGEVRTLKQFQRRLTARADEMTKVAEETRGLQAHAADQATKALRLMEAARAVEGGDKLITALTRLHEQTVQQAQHAEEAHKRAVRAAEACKTLVANTETRYGGIYKAVVDSDTTSPAELAFYKD